MISRVQRFDRAMNHGNPAGHGKWMELDAVAGDRVGNSTSASVRFAWITVMEAVSSASTTLNAGAIA